MASIFFRFILRTTLFVIILFKLNVFLIKIWLTEVGIPPEPVLRVTLKLITLKVVQILMTSTNGSSSLYKHQPFILKTQTFSHDQVAFGWWNHLEIQPFKITSKLISLYFSPKEKYSFICLNTLSLIILLIPKSPHPIKIIKNLKNTISFATMQCLFSSQHDSLEWKHEK